MTYPRRQLGMQCPSCGAISKNSDCCTQLGVETTEYQEFSDEATIEALESDMNSATDSQIQPQLKKSTLIEFPGVNRSAIPEWRKGLSDRVREVQERRAREAALERERQQDETGLPSPQLELLPPAEVPEMNPLVAAALKRIERAHQSAAPEPRQHRNALATAVAYAPAREENEPEVLSPVLLSPQLTFEPEVDVHLSVETETPPQIEKSHSLVVVTAMEDILPEPIQPESKPAPKRLIVDDPNDPALNYLDSISRSVRVDEVDTRRPSTFRRLVCGFLDLIICAALCGPIVGAMKMMATNFKDLRTIEVLAASFVVFAFIYFTLTIALTGRTWAMRLFSLRVIDRKTGLIPTGSQSVGRSLIYLISIGLAGLGILSALISREGYTAHDQLTRTAVILT